MKRFIPISLAILAVAASCGDGGHARTGREPPPGMPPPFEVPTPGSAAGAASEPGVATDRLAGGGAAPLLPEAEPTRTLAITVPTGFTPILSKPGVQVLTKTNPAGVTDYVTLADLRVADMRSLTGAFSGAPNAKVYREPLSTFWSKAAAMSTAARTAAVEINGDFFSTNENPTPLAFPLKMDGAVVSLGYALGEFPGKNRALTFDNAANRVAIESYSTSTLTASPDVVGALDVTANKSATSWVARTFVGVADQDGDGVPETVLLFSSRAATQAWADGVLKSFGATATVMVDGGGSTGLVVDGATKIAPGRTIPHAIVIFAGVASSGACAHSKCSTGDKLVATCDSCVSKICSVDSYCCSTLWDSKCVSEVTSVCGLSCGGTGGSGGTGGTGGTGGSGGTGGGGGSCTYACTAYGYSPGQCVSGWSCGCTTGCITSTGCTASSSCGGIGGSGGTGGTGGTGGSGGTGGGGGSCTYACTAYGYSPGQCVSGWSCGCTTGCITSTGCTASTSCSASAEKCDGIDNDANGVIDDVESCWQPIVRLWDTAMPISARSRCYVGSTAACSGYTAEFAGPVLYLARNPIPGTVALWAFDRLWDHILTRADATGDIAALKSAGYTQRGPLGYIWVSPPAGTWYKPTGATTGYVRDLRRYSYPGAGHLYANSPAETAPGWSYEGVTGWVAGSRW